MMPGPRLLRGSGMAQQVALHEGWKPYRWNGTPGWDPAAAAPPKEERSEAPRMGTAAAQVRARERLAEFTRLREQGVSVRRAGATVGVGDDRSRKYERMRLKALGGAEGAAS